MLDVQKMADTRELAIDKVGVKGLRHPITLRDRNHGTQQTVATIDMNVNLPHQFKGTHMSRFVEILSEYSRSIDMREFKGMLKEVKNRLDAEEAHIKLSFPYFMTKKAPVSGAEAVVDYDVMYEGSIDGDDNQESIMTLKVNVTTVCPCSKEISDRGAHNQRGLVTLSQKTTKFVWIEDMVRLIESAGSSEIYSLLKREDEKACTEIAYDNPRFVEDIVREIGSKLRDDDNVTWFKVESENVESIHNHNAYACIEIDKTK